MNKSIVVKQAKTEGFLPLSQGILQRKCACGNNTIAGGECTGCARKNNSLQRKLSIGASNDPLEREADRVADQVMAMSSNSEIGRAPPRIQRFTGQSTGQADMTPASVDRVLASSGRPMEPVLRQDMEQRFGHDFTQVRVHSGAAAEQSARDISAHAYTKGNNVVFGAGFFAPGTQRGRRLIAHELTHVVQQSGAKGIRTNQSKENHGLSPVIYTSEIVQRDFALPATSCNTPIQVLTQAQIQEAIQHSSSVISDPNQIAFIRDIIGISRDINTIDQDFVDALLRFQACFGLIQNGMLDRETADQLFNEILEEQIALDSASRVANDTMISLLLYRLGVDSVRQNIASGARTEFTNWNNGVLLENNPTQLDELQDYWDSVTNNPNAQAANSAADITPWSAVFISDVVTDADPNVRTIGFAPSAAHITYIVEALRNRECPDTQRCPRAAQTTGTRFRLYRPTEISPVVGDLICRNRGQANFNYAGLQQDVCVNNQCPGGTTHCDIVEQVNQNANILVIGGNVGNTVGTNALNINQAGIITNVNDLIGIIRVI